MREIRDAKEELIYKLSYLMKWGGYTIYDAMAYLVAQGEYLSEVYNSETPMLKRDDDGNDRYFIIDEDDMYDYIDSHGNLDSRALDFIVDQETRYYDGHGGLEYDVDMIDTSVHFVRAECLDEDDWKEFVPVDYRDYDEDWT